MLSFLLRSLIADSLADIQVSSLDENNVASHERLVTVTGNFDAQLKAIELILEKLSEDVEYPPNLSSPFKVNPCISHYLMLPQANHVAF